MGPIRRAVEPWLTQRMAQRSALTRLEWLPRASDKEAENRGAQALASMGKIKFPMRSSFTERVVRQLAAFPAGAFDDAVDVLGLAARGINLVGKPKAPPTIHATVPDMIDAEMGL